MPKRDLYRILGVPAEAAPGEIKRAYRRIAFSAHPDVGARPDPDRFREAREAYEVLSDPARRRSYDIEIARPRRPMSAEPLRAHSPVTIVDDFLTMRPSVEEVLDRIGRNFFGYREKSGVRPASPESRRRAGGRRSAVWLSRAIQTQIGRAHV